MKPIPIDNRIKTQPFIAVGCVIEKNEKFLLVQEAHVDRGQWNLPAGWLDLGEPIVDGAIREAKEETGLQLEATGFLGAYSLIKKSKNPHGFLQAIRFIFTAKITGGQVTVNPEEIMDAQWFNLETVKQLKQDGKLRDYDIVTIIENYRQDKIYPVELANHFYNQLDS